MRIDVLTIFPDMFPAIINQSMLRIAQDNGALEFHAHDLRDWTHDVHRTVDDSPYGGGAGMVMKVEPLVAAIEDICAQDVRKAHVTFLAPVGRPFTQTIAGECAARERLLFVCGRYEGFDERAFAWTDDCLSIGDYVLTGGEIPALVVIDATVRLLPGVLGGEHSTEDESFSGEFAKLLEYPHYTRPPEFRGHAVPEVLLSGNHAAIASWRKTQAKERTRQHRPDLLQ